MSPSIENCASLSINALLGELAPNPAGSAGPPPAPKRERAGETPTLQGLAGARAPLEQDYYDIMTGDMIAYFIRAFAGSFTLSNFSISMLRN
jgi:hypothetical protein